VVEYKSYEFKNKMKRLISAFIFCFKKKGGEGINNINREISNKGNVVKESRGHRVKSKKESTIKELSKMN
jgi:hypothetical protein